MRFVQLRGILAGVVGAVAVLNGGCGAKAEKPPTLYPVAGKLLIHGQPFQDVLVVFVPVNKAQEALIKRSTGITAPDGTFNLTTKKPDDGVPAGEYVVTFTYLEPGRFSVRPKKAFKAPRLDKKYGDPNASPIKVMVEPVPAGETLQIPPIELP